jgi:hypothetical protein
LSNGRPWTPHDQAIVDEHAGRMAVTRIAEILHRPVITVQRHMPEGTAYHPRMAGADRRQWLLCSAAGLYAPLDIQR